MSRLRSAAVRALVLAASVSLLLAGCGPAGSRPASRVEHPRVILVVEENHSYRQMVDSANAPAFSRMIGAGTLLTSYFGIAHPSLPNYIALLSGDTHGITSDCVDCFVDAESLPDQLDAAHITWRAYMEGLPATCSQVRTAGAYVRRHDPFMYFDHVRNDTSLCKHIVPLDRFYSDLASGTLPEFVWITPDLDHDMHGSAEVTPDSPQDVQLVRAADTWLGELYDRLIGSGVWTHDTRLVVTFDEGLRKEHLERESCCNGLANGGHIATVVVGPAVPHGVDATEYTHYSLLRSVETLYHLPYLGHAASPTKDIPVLAAP